MLRSWPLFPVDTVKFATVEDATTFVSLIQVSIYLAATLLGKHCSDSSSLLSHKNVCPISSKQEKASTSKKAPSTQASQHRTQHAGGASDARSSARAGVEHTPAEAQAMSPLPETSSNLHDPHDQGSITDVQQTPIDCAVTAQAPALPESLTDNPSTSAPSQLSPKKPVKKRAAPRAGAGKGKLKAAPKKKAKPNPPEEPVAQEDPGLPSRPKTPSQVVVTVQRITLPHLDVSSVAQMQAVGSQPPRYSLHSAPWLPSPPLKRNIILASGGLHGQRIANHPPNAEKQQIRQALVQQPLRQPTTTSDAQDLDVVLAGLCAKDRGELLEQTVSILKSPFFSVLVGIMERAG
jgi:hypothetical protein